jgi:hypothetical protein
VISWERFENEFLRKYFPEDLRNKKGGRILAAEARRVVGCGVCHQV